MIKASITLLSELYPTVKKVILQDESYIYCNDNKRQRLAHYYIAVYGKTWYESKLNATPQALYQEDYRQRIQTLQHVLITDPKPSFDALSAHVPQAIKYELRTVYNKSFNLQDMITTIANEYDCMMFRNWLDDMISQYIPNLMNMTWEIEVKPMIRIKLKEIEEIPRGMMMMGRARIPNTIGDFDSYR
jgi:hypothetical protein